MSESENDEYGGEIDRPAVSLRCPNCTFKGKATPPDCPDCGESFFPTRKVMA